MRALRLLLFAGGLLLAGAVGTLWFAQNADQTATLRLDLGAWLGAWSLAAPAPVPMLMLASFGVGACVVGLPLLFWGVRLRLRVRRLERTRSAEALTGPS